MYPSKYIISLLRPFNSSWKVVVNITFYFSYVSHIWKGYHPGAVSSLLLELNYLRWYNKVYQYYLHLVRLIWVPPYSVPNVKVLTLYLSST